AYAEKVGLALPEKGDDLFPMVALEGGLSPLVGVLFVVGFAAASLSSVGSALTALTTSFSVDVMQGKRLDESRLALLRKRTHTAMAVLLFGGVVVLGSWADESSINLIYRMAGYTYGPILGMFLFGLWSRSAVRDRLVWIPAVTAPVVMAFAQYLLRTQWQIEIGFELLIYNALLVMAGMWLLRRKAIS
ncbi:MAG: sodium:solute symporter, partial [Alistipes sp.]|nr:sodium:solute symporter [Alistipes sp.]